MRPIIVCVDDDPTLVRFMTLVLDSLEADVQAFEDPVRALEFLRSNEVALVVTDHQMPGLSGLELLSLSGATCPFVVVTGDLALAREASRVVGVSAVLTKPFFADQLRAEVSALLPPRDAEPGGVERTPTDA